VNTEASTYGITHAIMADCRVLSNRGVCVALVISIHYSWIMLIY